MKQFMIRARAGIMLASLLIPLTMWAQSDIESVYLVDISSSMLELYGNTDRNLLKDVICYIKNSVENLPDDHASVTLVVFATKVKTVRWDSIDPKVKTNIYRYLDRLADSTMSAWKNDPESLSSTYISRAILEAYASLKSNPTRTRQNLYLFSDGELLIPPNDPQPIDYPTMMRRLEAFHINSADLRFFYYFPLLISANRYLKELVDREEGEIQEHYEADLCTQSSTNYQNYLILMTVKDHHLQPFPSVTIRSPRIKNSYLTGQTGQVAIPIRSPSHFWYPFTLHHTGYADTYTHAYIDTQLTPQDTVRLVSIMMTPIPIKLNFSVMDQAQNTLPACSLILESPHRTRQFFLDRIPSTVLYYDYTPQIDSIRVTVKHPNYQSRSLPLHFNPNQNDYLFIIEMEKIRL